MGTGPTHQFEPHTDAELARIEWGVVPLALAALCQDCSMIAVPREHRCSKCASPNLLVLAKVLSRESDDPRTEIRVTGL